MSVNWFSLKLPWILFLKDVFFACFIYRTLILTIIKYAKRSNIWTKKVSFMRITMVDAEIQNVERMLTLAWLIMNSCISGQDVCQENITNFMYHYAKRFCFQTKGFSNKNSKYTRYSSHEISTSWVHIALVRLLTWLDFKCPVARKISVHTKVCFKIYEFYMLVSNIISDL